MTACTVTCQAPLSMGILQARIPLWVAIPFSREPSLPRDRPQVSCIAGRLFTSEPWERMEHTHNCHFSTWYVLSSGEGSGTPHQYSCLENPMDDGAFRLRSLGSLRVGHNWATSLSLFTFMHWRRKGQPTPVYLPGESQGWRSLVGHRLWGRTESDTTDAT